MPQLNIIIKRLTDITPSIDPNLKAEEAILLDSIILEHGMSSGAASIGFHIETPDGKHYVAQTSAVLLRSMVDALTGAEQFWKANP